MARSTFLYAAIAVFGCCSLTSAQSPVLAELYGRGVHAYNSGNLDDANRYLTMAIDNGSVDPRAYYFRGVVYSITGRADEAKDDWTEGAKLEIRGEYGLAIGRALQRIQGSIRIELENIRQVVRLQERASQSARNKARYNELQAAEAEVLRGGSATPPPAPPATPAEDAGNPFADDAMASGDPVPDTENNPFSDDPVGGQPAPAAPAAGGGADPFGGGAPAPAGGDPFGGGAPAPAGGADPFGGGAPAPAGGGADPFGGGAPAPAAGGADPFGGGAPAPAGGDPFGGGSAPEPTGATPAPAGGGADPFGGDPFSGGAPAPAGGAGADPFGGDPFAN